MTSSNITPIQAASDGGTTTDSSQQEAPAIQAKPERGIARLRENEVYHLMNLVQSALYEAEHLISEVLGQARPRYLDHDNSTEPLNAAEIGHLLSQAYLCATLASNYIDKVAMGLLDSRADAPF
jgi:hypothetical protein